MVHSKTILTELYYERKLSQRKIGKMFNVSGATICKWFKEFNITAKNFEESNIKSINANFFNCNTAEFAFALGYIFANSYLAEDKSNKDKLFLKIYSSNVFWIDKIRELIIRSDIGNPSSITARYVMKYIGCI